MFLTLPEAATLSCTCVALCDSRGTPSLAEAPSLTARDVEECCGAGSGPDRVLSGFWRGGMLCEGAQRRVYRLQTTGAVAVREAAAALGDCIFGSAAAAFAAFHGIEETTDGGAAWDLRQLVAEVFGPQEKYFSARWDGTDPIGRVRHD